MTTRCTVPECDGTVSQRTWKERIWDRYYTAAPELDVPGMTEYVLFTNTVLGLMPESGIVKLLGARLPDPSAARGIPRSELYLIVPDPLSYHRRALEAGGKNLSDLCIRDWGDEVAYCLDLDSHVLAFAKQIAGQH